VLRSTPARSHSSMTGDEAAASSWRAILVALDHNQKAEKARLPGLLRSTYWITGIAAFSRST